MTQLEHECWHEMLIAALLMFQCKQKAMTENQEPQSAVTSTKHKKENKKEDDGIL